MHEEQTAQQRQQKGPTAWDEYREYYQQCQDRWQRQKPRPQHREATKTDDGSSRFERFLETLHRSTTYRPSSGLFVPLAFLVVMIYGGISCITAVLYLYRGFR